MHRFAILIVQARREGSYEGLAEAFIMTRMAQTRGNEVRKGKEATVQSAALTT
jgi:hypothetical protein